MGEQTRHMESVPLCCYLLLVVILMRVLRFTLNHDRVKSKAHKSIHSSPVYNIVREARSFTIQNIN